MKKYELTQCQILEYKNKGFLFPVNILNSKEVKEVIDEINYIEKKYPKQINEINRNNIHYYSPIFDRLVHHSKILDVVENFIGKNILAAGSVLFLKEPENKGFISWHQDGLYQGWKPFNSITAWLALSEVNEENGCMKMLPESHKYNFREHHDTFDENNLLTRGQTIKDINEKDTVSVLLKPGQLSIHHPMTIHGSGPNLSKERRIGFAIQSYISDNVDQVLGKTYVQLARGNDRYKFHDYINRPKQFMQSENLIARDISNIQLQKVLYKNSKKIGKY